MEQAVKSVAVNNAGILARIRRRLRQDLLTAPGGQLDALNGLRGIACILVVMHHVASFSGNLSSGPNNFERLSAFFKVINTLWISIDVFFVISGFLIGRILITSLDRTGSVEFPRFFVRRAMRVFPAFYLVLTLSVFWYTRLDITFSKLLLVGPQGWEAMRDNSWMNYVYVMNYVFHAGMPNPMAWTWTLCVEEHFYLLLPAILVVLYRSRHRSVTAAGLAVITLAPLLGRAVQYLLDPTIYQQDGFFFRTHNRIDEIMVGVFLSHLYVHHHAALRSFATRAGSFCWIGALLLYVIIGVFGGINRMGMFSVVFQYFLAAMAASLLIINGLFLDNRATKIMNSHKSYFIARVSYGVYLLHPFILFALLESRSLFPTPTTLDPAGFLLLFGLTFALTLALAAIMFVTFERPMIDLGSRMTQRKQNL